MADRESILRQIRIARRFGVPRKGRIIAAKPRYPYALERTYHRQLRAYVTAYVKIVKQILIKKLPDLVNDANSLRPDSVHADNWVRDLAELINAITLEFGPEVTKTQTSIKALSEKVSDFNKEDNERVIRSVLGVNIFTQEPWLKDQLDAFLAQNTYLIKDLPEKATQQIQIIAQKGLANGDPADVIGQRIAKQFGITQRRAQLIARDQVATMNGVLTGLRQTALGITQFTWRTSLDERVRDLHDDREDVVFDWDHVFNETPDDGPPGIPINCRCIAEPVLTGLLEEI